MKQVVIIHGGNSFSSYEKYREYLEQKQLDYDKLRSHSGWKHWVAEQLADRDTLLPSMPNSLNAIYDEWKIYFEKILPFLGDDVQLVGHSLGAMFLAKYLHENPLHNKVRRLILISGGYNDETNEDLGSFGISSATGLEQSADEIHLFHSKDDPVVPFSELAKFQADLPNAVSHIFEDRGHFFDITSTFPELLELLQRR